MKAVSKKTGYIESFDGTRLYYEVRGSGKPIIMAYGIGCLINHWRHQFRYFSNYYQTIVFDYRGHHKSAIPEDRKNLNIDSLAKDLKQLTEHLNIKTASFWGHSFGAQVLLKTYDLYPDIFHNLIFINGFAKDPIRGIFGMDIASKVFGLFKQGYRHFPETSKFLWRFGIKNPLSVPIMAFAGGFNIHLTSIKDIEIYVRGVASMDLDVFVTLFDDMLKYDGTKVLEKVTVPSLIISGNNDSVTPQGHQNHLHEALKNSQLQSIPYGSHCTQLDLPDFVNLRAEKFLKEFHY